MDNHYHEESEDEMNELADYLPVSNMSSQGIVKLKAKK